METMRETFLTQKSGVMEVDGAESSSRVSFEDLPPEVVAMILPTEAEPGDFGVTATTCRFVCRTWYAVLPYSHLSREASKRFLFNAARTGRLELLRWAREEQGCPWGRVSELSTQAARGGHLPVLQWVKNTAGTAPSPWDEATCAAAAAGGHLDVLQWLRHPEQGCAWDAKTTAHAAGIGRLDILRWARRNGCPWDRFVCAWAVRGGHENVLKWAWKKGCPSDRFACAEAALSGNLELLKWLYENECDMDLTTCNYAARAGRIEVLEWACGPQRGLSVDRRTCAEAAAGGQLETLQWLIQRGAVMDEETCVKAAEAGHLEVLFSVGGKECKEKKRRQGGECENVKGWEGRRSIGGRGFVLMEAS